ncbi:bifunctional DNA primase/polymerase [Streptosporangium amethystogenes]|uniref:bifunctional DNA primase/polymerase n=1 Tax=Streptosporangium amethystogenes TaxID=2002 RepID=UPI00068D7AB3|nr:bifunctional DNA primase/polymerase [Streptosporangium amethystogenes]
MPELIMLAAALALVGQGMPVFPCVPNGKRPLGRLVPNGYLDATTDIELVTRWWTSYPRANVAVPTGSTTFDVLDVDIKPAGSGYPAFNRMKAAGLLPVPFAVISTPAGGLHCRYVGTEQACGSLSRHFIDWKSSGGYTLVPPSVVDGRPYTLVSERPQERHQLNFGAVRQFLDPPKPITSAPRRSTSGTGIPHLAAWLADKTKPGRNQSLFWAACRAAENGATEAELHALYAAMQFGDGFDERQAARTVGDAYRTTRRKSA